QDDRRGGERLPRRPAVRGAGRGRTQAGRGTPGQAPGPAVPERQRARAPTRHELTRPAGRLVPGFKEGDQARGGRRVSAGRRRRKSLFQVVASEPYGSGAEGSQTGGGRRVWTVRPRRESLFQVAPGEHPGSGAEGSQTGGGRRVWGYVRPPRRLL